MSRVDRVLDLLDFLRSHEIVTVAEIAAGLGVGRRTVLRDLATLRERGWPIRAESGPGGGVCLDRGRGVATVHLDTEGIVALWVASKLSASVTRLPWSRAARRALDKIFASLPEARRRHLHRLVSRVVVGAPATARIRAELGQPAPELLTAFEAAFAGDLCLGFDYVDRHGQPTQRIAEPHGLLVEIPAWYLLSRDAESQQPRMFRMDRIRSPKVLSQRPFVPDFEGLKRQRFGA
ncbi:MAG TPA: WYL domain-containing protein [Polyangiaceae bacterium]|nr:WYL domain-containing protein [Polyangiaceae bacterium]